MSRTLPKIVRDAQRARAAIQQMSIRMAKRHRYETGADLRRSAKHLVVTTLRTFRAHGDAKVELAREIRDAVDLLKLELQLGKDVDAFGRWAEFVAVVELVDSVGRQSGGWLRSLQGNGQNARPDEPAGQRASTLSSRSAPLAGANT
jgi:hypothetical protein